MELLKISPDVAPSALACLVTVARAGDGGLGQPERATIEALRKLVIETDLDLDSLVAVEPEALRVHFDDAKQARQLIRLMVVICLADGPPSPDQASLVAGFADALEVKEPAVAVVHHLAQKRLWRFRLSFFPHSHLRNYFRNTYRMTGAVRHVIKAILVFRGVREEPDLSKRFRSLELLPSETLGRQFFDHCVSAGLAFPGEKGGFPVGAVHHDFTHVLSGYDTSPEGEMKAAAFQAGYTQDEDDFFVALFAILIHTAGINVTPFDMPVLLGRIGQKKLALEVFHALQRGSKMDTDLGAEWDFWKYVELPIETVRDQLGILPVNSNLIQA